jgi:fructokinase
MNSPTSKTPIIFGEVLFDEFDNEERVLGGAPFNVAWHLQGFGLAPVMISRIGEDDYGEQIIEAMNAWGMTTAGIQRDDTYPTGRVTVALHEGQPRFDIVADVAYDFIQADDAEQVLTAHPPGILYHGSLASRGPVTRQTLLAIKQHYAVPTFVDINLRAPWWSVDSIDGLMQQAHWFKLNEDELKQLIDNPSPDINFADEAQSLLNRFHLQAIVLTRGGEGSSIITGESTYEAPPIKVTKLVDTVGAGDAFSAVTIVGLLANWDYATTLRRASEFAAKICEQRGATRHDKEFYQGFKLDWSL